MARKNIDPWVPIITRIVSFRNTAAVLDNNMTNNFSFWNCISVILTTFCVLFCLSCNLVDKDSFEKSDKGSSYSSKFFIVDDESLCGWDFGISNGCCTLVCKELSDNVVACIVDSGSNNDYELLAVFDSWGSLTGIGTMEQPLFLVCETDSTYVLNRYEGCGEVSSTIVYKNVSNTASVNNILISETTKSVSSSLAKWEERIKKIHSTLDSFRDSKNLLFDLHEGRWGDFWDGLLEIIAGDVCEELMKAGVFGIILNERINQVEDELYKQNMSNLYGECVIGINSMTKEKDGSFLIEVYVDNIPTIPDIVSIMTETIYQEVPNVVHAGVVCRKSYPAYLDYCDYKSAEIEVDGEKMTISFRLPKLETGNYSIKPYLQSSSGADIESVDLTDFVRYGNEENISVIGGRILGFEQVYETYNLPNVDFVVFVDAEIDSNEGLEEWGVYYEDAGGKYRFPARWPTATVKDKIRMELSYNQVYFSKDYERFVARCPISIGVYKKWRNPTGIFNYMYYDYDECSEFDLVYDHKPMITCESVSIIESNMLEEHPDYRYNKYEIVYNKDGSLFDNYRFTVYRGNPENNVFHNANFVRTSGTGGDGVSKVVVGLEFVFSYWYYTILISPQLGGGSDSSACGIKFDIDGKQ